MKTGPIQDIFYCKKIRNIPFNCIPVIIMKIRIIFKTLFKPININNITIQNHAMRNMSGLLNETANQKSYYKLN